MKKRFVSITVIISLLFCGVVGRLGYIIFSNVYTVSDSYNSYSIVIDRIYPTLYYRDHQKLTNNKTANVAVIRPNSKCLSELNKLFDNDDSRQITEELKKGYPLVKSVDSSKMVNLNYIQLYKTKTSDNLCAQLINKESSGLLKYVGEPIGEKKINFSIDAKGRLLAGDVGTIIEDNYRSLEGFTLTLNKDIQQITYDACDNMKSGCVVIMDIADSAILACVTKPDTAYENKVLEQFSVGSVFKIIVASCALDNSVNINYNCKGSIKVGDTVFSCQNNHIHSNQDLKTALANSCNCYFVNLALTLGSDKIMNTAKKLGFDSSTSLYKNWYVANAHLPSESDLQSKGQLSLLGFGQGKLTATPLQMCSALCTIANGGLYKSPYLVSGTVAPNGATTKISEQNSIRVLKKSTSDKMIANLRYVVTNGTGSSAESSDKKSAGKTATAQTGQFANSKELLNTWFAGIYPYDNPKYAIVVMTQDGISGSVDCCPVFSTIVENLP